MVRIDAIPRVLTCETRELHAQSRRPRTAPRQYAISLPQTDVAGNYTPHVAWDAGPRLRFNFGFTDLRTARYLEAFIPANLSTHKDRWVTDSTRNAMRQYQVNATGAYIGSHNNPMLWQAEATQRLEEGRD